MMKSTKSNSNSKRLQLQQLLREEQVLKAQLRSLRRTEREEDNHEGSTQAENLPSRQRQTLEAARQLSRAFAVEYPFNTDLEEEKTVEEREREALNEKEQERERKREKKRERERQRAAGEIAPYNHVSGPLKSPTKGPAKTKEETGENTFLVKP